MVSEDSGRRGFVRKIMGLVAAGGIASVLLGGRVEKAQASDATYDNLVVDTSNVNDGAITPGIQFGPSSGEGISSKRTATGNQYGLDFYTGYTPHMSILQGGNVGIGTTNPQAKLAVAGDSFFEANTNGTVLGVLNQGGSGPIFTQSTGLAASTEGVIAVLRGAGVQGDADKGFGVWGASNSGAGVRGSASQGFGVHGEAWGDTAVPIAARANSPTQSGNLQEWQNSGGQPLSVVDKAGQFGIGTATPARMLHIRGNNAVARLDRNVDSASFIFVRTSADFSQVWKSFTFGVKATGVDTGSFFIGDMHTNVSGSSDNRILIDTSGNVGIGTTTPSSKLHVNGRVKALGYDTGDITFANGYKLTEDPDSGMLLVNQKGENIVRFDEQGNIHIRGDIVKDL